MGIKIGEFLFEGSYRAPGDLRNKPGLFLITDLVDGRHQILDVDHADKVRQAVEGHARRECWLRKSQKGELRVSVLYTPELTLTQRAALEADLRRRLAPPCGKPVPGLAEMAVEG